MLVAKKANEVTPGDIIVTKDKGEHLVLIVAHKEESTRLRTVNIATGEPKTRIWKHTRNYQIDVALSSILPQAA